MTMRKRKKMPKLNLNENMKTSKGYLIGDVASTYGNTMYKVTLRSFHTFIEISLRQIFWILLIRQKLEISVFVKFTYIH